MKMATYLFAGENNSTHRRHIIISGIISVLTTYNSCLLLTFYVRPSFFSIVVLCLLLLFLSLYFVAAVMANKDLY